MIKSWRFWIAAALMALIPLLTIDIIQHYLDWQKDVREEIIIVVQNLYSFNRQQKASILDKVFERNQTLTLLVYVKSTAIIVSLVLSFYYFKLYKQRQPSNFLKSFLWTLSLMTCFVLLKVFVINKINTEKDIHLLTLNPDESSLKRIYDDNFKGKIVYVDFWGTTCGPCLAEFRNFTQPVKDRYSTRNDISYLYVAQGNEYLWHEQIKKYDVKGYHIFVKEKQYENLYKRSTKDTTIQMPHYLIIDKNGNIVEPNAKQPSDVDSLHLQLAKYLAPN